MERSPNEQQMRELWTHCQTQNIPLELKKAGRFVNWRIHERSGSRKPTKIPYSPLHPGTKARMDDPSTWSDFFRAVSVAQNSDWNLGIGFVFMVDAPYVGVDLDHCRNPDTGDIKDWALTIVRQLDSYTEISPSGTGVKIIARGSKPGSKCRKGNVEMYESGRFFTLTGQLLQPHA